ncbi:MAG: peptidase [Alphaproteobacteria bacterium]|nr:peptidase [Alphaproteobacteria bacterium]
MRWFVVAAVLALAAPVQAADKSAVLKTYADIALAIYEDSLTTARGLQTAVRGFLAKPSAKTQEAVKQAWLAARVPYQQSEVYRFGNTIVDEWEGRVNAWPLDEGLIDYVDADYGKESEENSFYTANVIANRVLLIGGKKTDARVIDAKLIRSLHEIDEVEANVATGYHAVEFLLWGQDLNGTEPGAGARPWTDFALGKACTGGHCDRRRAYLLAATALLIDDLEDMVANWQSGGKARKALVSGKPTQGLAVMLKGMGSLSYGELAGERMKLGLMLHDPEEEHDCFSDNTHNSHYYNQVGIRNVYLGRYQRTDGRVVEGPSLSDLVKAKAPKVDADMRRKMDAALAALDAMRKSAESGRMAYDQMIGEGNAAGNAMVQHAIDALLDQTKAIEKAVAALDLGSLAFEGSDSLDNPAAVFK